MRTFFKTSKFRGRRLVRAVGDASAAPSSVFEALEDRRLMAVTPPEAVITSPSLAILTDANSPVFRFAVGETNADNDGTGATATAVITQSSADGTGTHEVFRHDYVIANRGSFSDSVNTNQFGLGIFTLVLTANDAEYAGTGPQVSVSKTIRVNDDDTTAPTVAFDEPRIGQSDEATTPLTWGYATDVATATLTVTRDGTEIFNGPAPASHSLSYGNVPGTYVATLTVTDNDNDRPNDSLSNTATKTFTVTDDDVTPPTAAFDHPRVDPQTDEAPVALTWGYGVDVTVAKLTVTHDGTVIFDDFAPAARTLDYAALTGHALGTYVATLTVTDDDNDRPDDALSTTVSKTFNVVDDDTAPPTVAFDQPDNPVQTDGDPTALTWGYSPDVTSAVLTVSRNGTVLFSGPAPTSGTFNYGNTLGSYTATLTVTDDDNDRPNDSLSATASKNWTVVDDDTSAPTVAFDQPDNPVQTDGDTTALTWGYSPDVTTAVLTVSRDGTVLFSGPAPASHSYNYGNTLGNYSATLTVTDDDNDRSGDSLSASANKNWSVVDDDTSAPTVAFDQPDNPVQTDGDPTALTWGYSPDVSAATLTVSRDGTVLFSGPAPAGHTFNYGTTLGNYTATLTVTDNDNDRAGDSLGASATKNWSVVDDDTTAPTVAFDEPRISPLLDSAGTPLTWGYATDVATATLTITRDGTTIFSGPAPASRSYNYGNALGNYVATLSVTDNDNDRAGDALSNTTTKSWSVVDDDTTAPTVVVTNVPGGDEVTDAQPRRFEWGTTDNIDDVPIVTVRVTRDTATGPVTIFTGTDTGGRFDLTSFGLGTFTMTVTATDRDNDRPNDALTTTVSKTLRVVAQPTPQPTPNPTPNPGTAVLADDPGNPGRKMLVVTGTTGNDCILVSRALAVKINGQNKGSFGSNNVSRVVIYGLAGNDFIWAADSYTGCGDSDSCVFGRVTLPTYLYGGAGNDLLVMGNGGGAISGGDGNDLLLGGAGRDLLIGGDAADAILGLSNDDILVAGYTSYDNNDPALFGVVKEWSRTDRAYLDRIRALKGEISGLNGAYALRTDGATQNVFDDGAADEVDMLVGGDGNDWFLFNTGADGGARDILVGATGSEVSSDIDAN